MTKVIDRQGRVKETPGFPTGAILPFYGLILPAGWGICDGTLGTPDLTDRFIIGDSVVGTGSASGANSAWTSLTHSGAAVANHSDHAVTQPAAHSNHVVTQPSAHSAHSVTQPNAHGTHASFGGHTHDAHTTLTRTGAGVGSEVTLPTTHNNDGAHTHDAHSAHSGMAVDAHSAHAGAALDAHSAHAGTAVDSHSVHSVTQATGHSIYKNIILVYIMKLTP